MPRGLELWDTASQGVRALELTRPVGVYVCGVTPYDTTHLGHAFTYVAFDLLVRYLRFLGVEVRYVQNVTDIDDDILLRSSTLGRDWRELGESETRKFLEDMDALNWQRPTIVKATEHIDAMIAMVGELVARGCAYERNGSVYFDVASDGRFGHRLGDLSYDAALLIANERGNYPEDPDKRDPLDFVLWQRAKEGEPSWGSPWGEGRPGWHIECSAMSLAHLAQPVTVHGGGDDLRFPHHEAEVSQTECATGRPFVEHWMHTAMVYSGEKKMSKSLGNMAFVRDLLESCEPAVLRLYLLSHHYRRSWDYEPGALRQFEGHAAPLLEELRSVERAAREELERDAAPVLDALADDLDTPGAIDALRTLAGGSGRERSAARVVAEDVLGLPLSR